MLSIHIYGSSIVIYKDVLVKRPYAFNLINHLVNAQDLNIKEGIVSYIITGDKTNIYNFLYCLCSEYNIVLY